MTLQLDPFRHACAIHKTHKPLPWVLHGHHVIPLAWSNRLGWRPYRTVPLCPTGHENTHVAIRQLIAGEKPLRQIDERMRPLVDEALEFWERHEADLFTGLEDPDDPGFVMRGARLVLADDEENGGYTASGYPDVLADA